MAYGKIKADTLVYDNSGSDVETSISSLAAKAGTASPAFTGTATAVNLTLSGNLQVNGTTTTVASSTMTVADKNIELAKGAANDAAADGGGITLESGDGNKTWNWVDATDAWTSSEHVHLGDNKKLLVGTGSDLQIYHDSNNSYIDEAGTGQLTIRSSKTSIQKYTGEICGTFTADGSCELFHDNTKKIETTAAGVTVSGTVTDSKGNVRQVPANTQSGSSNYDLVAADSGKAIARSGGNVTVPNSIFTTGDLVTIINNSAADITLTQGSGVTMYNSADQATGDRTLAARGMATIYFTGASSAYISGAGLG